jgi:ribonuclease T2
MVATSVRNTGGTVLCALISLLACASCDSAEPSQPGEFDYYTLVLSWSPTYCTLEGRRRRDAQCTDGHERAFTLHGLWPQYEKGWPQDCRLPHRPYVPESVIREMRDIMPGRGLVIHEYRAHGTCSGLSPEQYFATSRELYDKIAVPPSFRENDQALHLSLANIETDFLEANPWLKPEMIAISCRDGQLLDIRVCFDRELAPRACGANEDQRKLCKLDKVKVPPADND